MHGTSDGMNAVEGNDAEKGRRVFTNLNKVVRKVPVEETF